MGTVTSSGAVAATTIGTAILIGSGWPGGIVLITFFVTSNLLPRLLPFAAGALDLKERPRHARQVFANGGAAAAGALVGTLHADLGMWLVTSGLAAAAADTWATEAGQGAGGTPRDVLTGEPVPIGTSGGVTTTGSVAGALGAATIAAVGGWLIGSLPLVLVGAGLGFGGMVVDSILGARWQVRFVCPSCRESCEEPHHTCGALAVYERGVRWLTNDSVNALATTFTTAGGWLAWWLLGSW